MNRKYAGDIEAGVREIEETKDRIWALMRGRDPSVQSAIIADMLATLLAGHAPPIRDVTLEAILDLTKALVPVNERLLFGDRGHPYMRERE